jgi:PAS domain S-box-containing protein
MKPIIIIEDDQVTWFLLRDMLVELGFKSGRLVHCSTISEVTNLAGTDVTLVLTDLSLPDSSADITFEIVCHSFPNAPIIVVTGSDEMELAIKTIKQGAQDYLVKGEIDKRLLSKAIHYAIERKRSDNSYRQLFLQNPAPMYIYDRETLRFLAVNEAARELYGYTENEFLQLTMMDIRTKDTVGRLLKHLEKDHSAYYNAGVWQHLKKDGTLFYAQIYAHTLDFDGRPARMVTAIDVDLTVRTEQALHKKIKKVDRILESMNDAFFTVNINHEFTYINSAFEKVLSRRREELLGRKVWETFPEAVDLQFYTAYYRAINERVSVFFEDYLPTVQKWLSIKIYPLSDGLAVYFVDTTEQKEAAEKVLKERQNLSAIINNTKDIIWSMDKDNNIISANDAFRKQLYRLTGKTPEEITPADFLKETFEEWIEYFSRAFNGENYKTILKDERGGEKFFSEVSFNPIWNEDGEVTGVSCFSRDITAEKRMQEKIIADDRNLKSLIDNTDALIWSVNQNLELITANQAYRNTVAALWGKPPSPGEPVLMKEVEPEYYKQWATNYKRALSGERFMIEQELNIGDQTTYAETRFNPIYDDDTGNIIGVSCFTRDITELKEYAQRLKQQNNELLEIAWLQSHKVRSHVATILGLTQLINYNNPLDEGNLVILDGVRQSSEALDHVIREINDKTRMIDK